MPGNEINNDHGRSPLDEGPKPNPKSNFGDKYKFGESSVSQRVPSLPSFSSTHGWLSYTTVSAGGWKYSSDLAWDSSNKSSVRGQGSSKQSSHLGWSRKSSDCSWYATSKSSPHDWQFSSKSSERGWQSSNPHVCWSSSNDENLTDTNSWSKTKKTCVWKRSPTNDTTSHLSKKRKTEDQESSQKDDLLEYIVRSNKATPKCRASLYFSKYQREIWYSETFYFSQYIRYYYFSYKSNHPFENEKSNAIERVKKDLDENLELVRTIKLGFNNTYVLVPKWRATLQEAKKREADMLSGCFFLTTNLFPESMQDGSFFDFGKGRERNRLNDFVNALKDCITFDGGLQHLFWKTQFEDCYGKLEAESLPSFCPCGNILESWRKQKNLDGRRNDSPFKANQDFPFCTNCDDGNHTPDCFATPQSLLRHLYVKGQHCALHLLTLLYLLRLYQDFPKLEQFIKEPKKAFENVSWDMHNLEKLKTPYPIPSLF